MTREIRVFDKDEIKDSRKALVEYWNCWLARYTELYEK